ncbi:hypothetical protein ACFLY6_01600 [Candidatus Dependentiae bacterium]
MNKALLKLLAILALCTAMSTFVFSRDEAPENQSSSFLESLRDQLYLHLGQDYLEKMDITMPKFFLSTVKKGEEGEEVVTPEVKTWFKLAYVYPTNEYTIISLALVGSTLLLVDLLKNRIGKSHEAKARRNKKLRIVGASLFATALLLQSLKKTLESEWFLKKKSELEKLEDEQAKFKLSVEPPTFQATETFGPGDTLPPVFYED